MSVTSRRCVSVVIPAHNVADRLTKAARSALDQAETLEVILVEDGSVDGTLDVCRALAASDERVRVVRHDDHGNHGAAASRNLGLRHVRAPYVAFLDADDWYLPNRFAVSVPILEARRDVGGVWEPVSVEFEDDDARAEWAREPHDGLLVTIPAAVRPEDVLGWLLDGRATFCTDGIVVRRTVFDVVGLFDEDLPLGSDVAMWWKIAACHRLVAGDAVTSVAVYRRRRGSLASVRTPAYRDASIRLAMTVWRWAATRAMPRETRERLGMALIERILNAPPGTRGWRSLTSRIARIVGSVRRAPELLLYPRLWGRMLASRVSGKAPR